MGEAKRRKQAGTFSYRAAGHVEDYRVPDGMIGVTVEVPGVPPVTLDMATAHLDELMAAATTTMSRKPYPELVQMLAQYFAKQFRARADLRPLGYSILWTALYHPRQGEVMRKQVTATLRDKGRAHLTWQVTAAGLAISVSDTYIDFADKVAELKKSNVALYISNLDEGGTI
jgi:hypothetical protein